MPNAHGKSILAAALIVASTFTVSITANGQMGANTPPSVPYTAEFKTTRVNTLANGTTIRRETKSILARDSQGRVFNENEFGPAANGGNSPVNTMGTIHDQMEGSDTTWQSQTHVATVIKLPPSGERHGCWVDDAGTRRMMFDMPSPPVKPVATAQAQPPQTEQPKIEDLGTAMIEGVEVHGRRITRTIPAGRIGNDQPLVVISENWSAPSLGGLTLKSVYDDPRGGKSTREITHLDLGEPDPSLFQPPAGYQVKIQELHQAPCEMR